MLSSGQPLVAVDIGNSRTKLGWFAGEPPTPGELPTPTRTLDLIDPAKEQDRLAVWLRELPGESPAWYIGSVNRPTAGRLLDWLRDLPTAEKVTLLTAADLPLTVRLPRPDMVGIDRLLAAVAGNQLRGADRPLVIVDLGSAITVDLIAADASFCGGAILLGIGMSARALHEFTDQLPLIEMHRLAEPPPALGTATREAMESGLFWGAVGAAKELIARLGEQAGAPPQVLLTGGAAPSVAALLGTEALYEPHLTLSGIALSARSLP